MTKQSTAAVVEGSNLEEHGHAIEKTQSQRLTAQMARVEKRCDRVRAELAVAVEKCQQQLADFIKAFPIEEAPWRLPTALTFQEEESDWGRAIQFLSDAIVKVDRVRQKVEDLARYHRDSIVEADIEDVAFFGPRETLALKRIFDLAMAAAKGAQEACVALQALADGPDELCDNWHSILLLSDEIQFYSDSIPNAEGLFKMGHTGPLDRHLALSRRFAGARNVAE